MLKNLIGTTGTGTLHLSVHPTLLLLKSQISRLYTDMASFATGSEKP